MILDTILKNDCASVAHASSRSRPGRVLRRDNYIGQITIVSRSTELQSCANVESVLGKLRG